ncbi:hypothetical protein BDK51DRAFT_29302 [Blyttiomyces helicus]|uniref:Uncharacterized protein n=1 Tax=Blyttiomyces helicus TaxID=388810 RepID=A0A4V1IS14_9FUNG|nr:hypothetical protein BDK51DRAFT_29302 [Blyttiomyces helicus]|eukprot:RKO91967.1 hypothetical protein BDK51DRAFT_29302 [Blyttiomyces helicus]
MVVEKAAKEEWKQSEEIQRQAKKLQKELENEKRVKEKENVEPLWTCTDDEMLELLELIKLGGGLMAWSTYFNDIVHRKSGDEVMKHPEEKILEQRRGSHGDFVHFASLSPPSLPSLPQPYQKIHDGCLATGGGGFHAILEKNGMSKHVG